MAAPELAPDVVSDLLRSAWIVESARASVYADWGTGEERFARSCRRARSRATVLHGALEERGVAADTELVGAHAEWIHGCAGGPRDPLGPLLLARLGDWVDAHALPYVSSGGDRMRALSDEERSTLVWPSAMPVPVELAPPDGPPPPSHGADEAGLRIAVLADLHIGAAHADALAAAAIADINASGADVVVQLGDLTDSGNRDEFEAAAALLGTLEAPLATMMGNHDVYSATEQRLAGREYFREFFGRAPDGVLLEQSGFRLAVLDSVDHEVSPFAPFDLVTGTFLEGVGGAVERGALSERQHEILAELAAPGGPPAFVFLHHPPQPFVGFPPVIFGLRDADSGRIHATCDSGNVWGVFAGHTHRNHKGAGFDAVPTQEVAAPPNFPCGYALIDAAAAGYTYHWHQISDAEALRPAVELAGPIHRRYALGAPEERAFSWRNAVLRSV
jgi:hypothetical protein